MRAHDRYNASSTDGCLEMALQKEIEETRRKAVNYSALIVVVLVSFLVGVSVGSMG